MSKYLPSLCLRIVPVVVATLCTVSAFSFFPSFSFASAGSAEFFVSAWLVRLWLALVSGTAIIIGVMIALDSYAKKHTTEPVLTPEAKVVLEKTHNLSYRKIGGGLLCVLIGSALFVTAVFLLPDKRTGHSGIGKIVARFTGGQTTVHGVSPNKDHMPSGH